MGTKRASSYTNEKPPQRPPAADEEDSTVMSKIRSIIRRGNNAEVKGEKDGSLRVMEVRKSIV